MPFEQHRGGTVWKERDGQQFRGKTAIVHAATHGQVEEVSTPIDQGADLLLQSIWEEPARRIRLHPL